MKLKRAGIQELNQNRPISRENLATIFNYPLLEEELPSGEPDSSGMKKVLLGESEVLTSDNVMIPFNFIKSVYVP